MSAASPELKLSEMLKHSGCSSIFSESFARYADRTDALSRYRKQFHFPKVPDATSTSSSKAESKESVYLCGNSLGLQPIGTKGYIDRFLKKWAAEGVEGHFTQPRQWVDIDETVNASMAKIVGAKPNEVVMMNSLTANLHFLMASFYRPTKQRYKILIESKAFPSDIYAVKSQISYHGHDFSDALIQMEPRRGENTLRIEDIEALIDREGDSIALVLFSGVQYYTGQAFEMDRIAAAAHRNGCVCGVDLAHAVGNIPLRLHDWNVDFAVWCSYKYLNSGPGNIGGAFVHERHDASLGSNVPNKRRPRFEGWWGHRPHDRFMMNSTFEPARGVRGFQLSNPPVFCVESLRASLDVFEAAGGMRELRKKSEVLTLYLERLLLRELGNAVSIITPKEIHRRGCQLSLVFGKRTPGKAVHDFITDRGVICDFREPDVMRIAPAPLYNSFSDVFNFVRILREGIEMVRASERSTRARPVSRL
eukprot:g1775.t1